MEVDPLKPVHFWGLTSSSFTIAEIMATQAARVLYVMHYLAWAFTLGAILYFLCQACWVTHAAYLSILSGLASAASGAAYLSMGTFIYKSYLTCSTFLELCPVGPPITNFAAGAIADLWTSLAGTTTITPILPINEHSFDYRHISALLAVLSSAFGFAYKP